MHDDYRELRRRVQSAGLLQPQPRSFGLNILVTAALLIACIALLTAFHGPVGIVLGALFLSVISVQLAFIVHDAGHRQGFVRRWQNALVGIVCGNLLSGGSYRWWVKKHNRHHAHPNDVDRDPDMDLPLFALTTGQADGKRGLPRLVARYQVYCAVPLLTLLVYGQRIASVRFVLSERSSYRRWEAAALILNAALYLGVPLYFLGAWSTLLLIVVHQAATGLYLGLVFAPNHKGMVVPDADAPLDALRSQVLTARDVRGNRVTDWCYGGLNYQIEHHLFPALPRNRLPAAQRIVAAFCREQNIPYHETSILRSYREILGALHVAAAPLRPQSESQ
ncbi:MAG: fatty acid desaturase family protein [Thermomicrobiales bacterium]